MLRLGSSLEDWRYKKNKQPCNERLKVKSCSLRDDAAPTNGSFLMDRILARVRWRILEWLLPFLFLTILVNDIQPIRGAPQSSARFSSPQRQQNPSFGQAGTFQIIPDDDDFEDIVFSPARQRNFRNGASSSFGVPLSATRSGARQETLNAASAHFGAPLRSSTSGARSGSQQTQPASFGVPLSASQPGPSQTLPTAVRSHFGVPLSATRPGLRQEVIQPFPGTSVRTSQTAGTHFGVPLSNTRSGSQQQINNAAENHFGISRGQPGSSFTVRRDSVEDLIDDVSVEAKSHFSIPTHRRQNSQRYSFDDEDDNISIERFDKSSEFLSLGRRFHPEGIPRLSKPILTNVPSSARDPVISNPYIFTPDVASVDRDSLEDDDDFDDDTFLVLSPMVKAYNPSAHNERLSLSNDFLNQYNFVDVQGSTHWGYQTDSQYQDHKIHDSGAMEGKFGWTSPEGAEVNIKYIADEGGYRVLSSSGIYTREDEAVLRLKEQHLAEHEKARIHHQNVKAERNEVKTGVPLRNDFKGPQGSSISGSDSSVGVPLPTHSQDQNTGFGVPLPDQAVTRDQSSFKPHSFGVPLPDPSLTGTRDFGVPLPDPTLSVTSGNQAVGVPLPGAGASIPDSTFGINEDVGVSRSDPTLTGTQKVGVPLPGSTLPGAQSVGVPLPDPTFSRGQTFPDSTFSAGQGIGVPLPDPTFTESFRPETTFTDFQGVGVPLPDPTLSGASGTRTQQDSTFSRGSDSNLGDLSIQESPFQIQHFQESPRDQTKSSPLPSPTFSETPRESVVGVPLPDPTLSGTQKAEAPQPTFSGNQNRAPFPDPALSGFQSVGVPLPDPTFSGNQGVGVPLGGTTFSGTPAGERAGVSLPDASHRSSPHAGSPAGVFLPDHFLPGNQDFGVPLFDPILTNQQGFIPQSDPTISGNEAFGVPLSAVSGHHATGASIGGPASTFLTEDTQGTSGVSLFSQNEVSPVMTEPVVAIDSIIPQKGVTEKTPTEGIQESFGVPLSKNTELPSSKVNELPVPAVDSPALSDVAPSRVATEETQGIFGAPLTIVPEISSDTGSQSPKETIVDPSIPSDVATAIIPTKEAFDISRFILNERPSSKTTESATDSSAPSSVIPETFPTKDTQTFGVPLSIFADIPSAKTSELPFEALLPSGHNTEENIFGAPLFSGVPSLSESSSVVKSSTKGHSGSALDASSQTNFHSEANEQTIPLEPVSLIPSTEESLSQPEKNFFLVSDNIIAGGPQDFGVGLNEGPSNTLPPFNKEFLPTGGSGFGSLPNVGVPLGPVTFSGVDLLQGPPVEQLDPSFTGDRFPKGLDPCLNSKLHPTLLPPHCANANVEPNQRIGKSLVPSSSNKEQPEDSFIVVVNSDIFH
ncbi:hypothetical protein Anas_09725 [Armadillidium nasatum]|uniref:Uncharacterized protein n=1 Tax=Armadillidium nasatum TaxID=96803 RepID=A0A5N5SPV7_9CRUS|nr:hypothetical protein Anas_09725 [Armadillidium nasatum]